MALRAAVGAVLDILDSGITYDSDVIIRISVNREWHIRAGTLQRTNENFHQAFFSEVFLWLCHKSVLVVCGPTR